MWSLACGLVVPLDLPLLQEGCVAQRFELPLGSPHAGFVEGGRADSGWCLEAVLSRVSSFWKKQWAYQRGHSSRDLVALLVVTWLMAFDSGQKIGAFFSDISGAFDRAPTERLLATLHAAGSAGCCIPFSEHT